MTKKPTLSETGSKVTEIANAASKVEGVMPRALDEMPKFVHHKGAKEIAVLTVAVREQAFTFKPVMEALQSLASGGIDWSLDYLVAHDLVDDSKIRGPSFSWRDSPWKRYASFEDFYHRELEATWGKWETLQHTYAQIARGEISESDARREIEARARHAREVDAKDQANQRPVGRPAKQLEIFDDKKDGVKDLAPTGNSEAYAMRKLREDAPAIHARVLAGEIKANAGMIEAGFRKKRGSRKLTTVQRLLRLWAKATAEERAEFRAVIDDEAMH